MRSDTFTKVTLVVIACMLTVIALGPFVRGDSVLAQSSGARFGFLHVGSFTLSGGAFIDMRNGNLWGCDFQGCKVLGRYPLEQISAVPAK